MNSPKGPSMKPTRNFLQALALAALLGVSAQSQSSAPSDVPKVTPPPESFFELINAGGRRVENPDITPHRNFYKKYLDVRGLPVVAAQEVDDLALQRTYEIVTHMLAGRPDILKAMVDQAMYLIIIGKDQVYTDMPEYRNHPNPQFQNERVRGTGGRPTSSGEENLLSLPIDRYDDESIAVHEFCHTIDSTLARIDPTWRERKEAIFRRARDKGLYKDTYAIGNAAEYWCEIAQAYFDTNRINNWNHGPIGHREQLKAYDPEGYELVRTTFNLSPEQDWRYTWLQPLPNVTAPPAKFNIDPYYTKFTWAREFTVVGRLASDEALLHANETIRRMFAYRHDILKAIMAQGVKLVVLGQGESISDLPEYKAIPDVKGIDALSRYLDYSPAMKLLVVGEENVLADPRDMYVGDSQLVRVFARAIHQITGARAVDPEFSNKGRNVQQYELRVERMDERFDARLKDIYEKAVAAGKWKGTSAVHDRVQYWTAGVLAYFDALGQDGAPNDAAHPVRTRELLQQYDPDLFALVHETMAYGGKVDWRYVPYRR